MCDPLSAIAAGLGIVNYMGGQASAKATHKAQSQAAQLNYSLLNEKQLQTNQKTSLEQSERIKQGMLERATIATIAGESGALGLSSDRLITDSFMQEGTDIASMEKNRLNEVRSLNMKKTEQEITSQGKTTEAYNSAPSLVGTGLQIGSDIYSGSQRAKDRAKQKTNTNINY